MPRAAVSLPRLAAAVAVAAVMLPAGGGAAEPALVDRVQRACDRLESLRADFVQSLRSEALGRPQVERGELYLRRPSLMRWEYRRPERKLAVVDGSHTWLYLPAENQVIVGDLEEARRSGVTGLLLAGTVDLRRDFRLEPGPAGTEQTVLVLSPREPSSEFARLEVEVSPEDHLPRRITVVGTLGDVMEVRLENLRTGVRLADGLFRFEPPPGVEVLQAD